MKTTDVRFSGVYVIGKTKWAKFRKLEAKQELVDRPKPEKGQVYAYALYLLDLIQEEGGTRREEDLSDGRGLVITGYEDVDNWERFRNYTFGEDKLSMLRSLAYRAEKDYKITSGTQFQKELDCLLADKYINEKHHDAPQITYIA